MEISTFYFSWFELGCFGMLLTALIVQIYYYLRYFTGIIHKSKENSPKKIDSDIQKPPVSVVICARDEEINLRKFLPMILQQNYPQYEVIVVDDGSYDNTEEYLLSVTKQYPHLKTSFVPKDAKSRSTKKLGLTIGIKAASYDLLLFTDADCMPEGNLWISEMVKNFHPQTEFVLGYGGYLKEKGFLNKLIKFDTLFIGMQYLGMAIARRPYMGVGRNMAYRKETFFKMKGFASTLGLLSGDDDLMIQRGANKTNVEVAVSAGSVTWSEPKTTFKRWLAQKERHLSVSEHYKNSSKLLLAVEPASRGLFYTSIVLITVFGNWVAVAAAILLLLLRWFALQMPVINKSARILGDERFYFTIPLFDVFLPLNTLYILIFKRKNRNNLRWK
ncbi:MAG: glycosyltransferase [Paludibacteraceae bacterium]